MLEVTEPPTVDRLYFWALQAAFHDGRSLRGAAHLGLQWHPGHPGSTAVNWGGYASPEDGGGELDGSASELPSALDNPNTRDLPWRPARPYRLRIHRSPDRGWRGEVTDLAAGTSPVVVRDLYAPGRFLARPVVWSEVFARCDHPPVAVRWSQLQAVTADGEAIAPGSLRATYQSRRDGGCDNTTVIGDGDGVIQRTSSARQPFR